MVEVRFFAFRDVDVDFLRVAGGGRGASHDAKRFVEAIDAASRPEKITQRLDGHVWSLNSRTVRRAQRIGERPPVIKLRSRQADRLEPAASGPVRRPLIHVRLRRRRVHAAG